jgi:16S rRNA (cytosine967-C5)-methyltransferase
MLPSARQLALIALRDVHHGAFADVALDRTLRHSQLSEVDRRLVTELVYGTIRRQRTLDALIDRLAKKKSEQQPETLRLILHLGLYQLRYLDYIPAAAAVNTTVELAKQNGFPGLAGFVNGLLRQYLRNDKQIFNDIENDIVSRLGIEYSYPDWIIQVWLDQFGPGETEKLCQWLNQSPHIDLRVNILRTTLPQVEAAMQDQGIAVQPIPRLPQALRLTKNVGAIQKLPGFAAGWWTVQEASAQLVGHCLDPQPGEVVIDACAAPGGKTTHLAELMGDRGTIWAYDRYASRLKKLQENLTRLELDSIHLQTTDSRTISPSQPVDRVLLDVPCSGLGTLHRHADARWRQNLQTVHELTQLQYSLLTQATTWLKPEGILVYSTCTLHPAENEAIIERFLVEHPHWCLDTPPPANPAAAFVTERGWVKILPHQHDMDGFFMARLRQT